MISVRGLTQRYGDVVAVDDLTFDVEAGKVTGFLGPNGAPVAAVTSTADHVIGGIVPTLQWTPRRGVLLAARVGVIVATATLLGVLLVSVASAVVGTFLPEAGLPLADGAEVFGGLAFVFATGALLAVGLGLLLRSTAGGLVSVTALVVVLAILLAQLPYGWSLELSTVMPGSGAST